MSRSFQALTLATVVCLGFTTAAAEPEPEPEEELPRHHLGLFLGVTAGGKTEGGNGREPPTATIGLEYNHRVTRNFRTGIVAEYAGGERRDYLGLVPFSFFPKRRTKYTLGVGLERSAGTEEFDAKTKPILRLGFAYDVELSRRHTIAPEFSVDFIDGEALYVLGVTIGWNL